MLPCKLLRQCVTLIGLIFIISCDQTPEVSDALPEPVKNPVSNKEEIDPDAAPSSPNPESPTPPTTNPSSNPAAPSNSNNGFVGDGGNSGGGGGGGSGGGGGEAASAVGPNGICGNGIQEVSPGAHNKCIYDLYGTTTNGPNGPSSLFFFANDTGVGYQIGVVSEETVGVERIGAIDFDSRGVLYGVGERSSDSKSVLLTIDCVTAQATIIGLTNIDSLFGSDAVITDIDIDAQGRFYAFSDSNTNPNVLGLLNPLTGAFTTIGAAGVALASWASRQSMAQTVGAPPQRPGKLAALPAVVRRRIPIGHWDHVRAASVAAARPGPRRRATNGSPGRLRARRAARVWHG